MRVAIISDIHSNLQALTAVLRSIGTRKVDAIYCLGDIVGYGADPATCVELVRKECKASVRGNHDQAVALDHGLDWLPKDARKAAIHNRLALSDAQLEFLGRLEYTHVGDGFTFVHASPKNPHQWTRVESLHVALDQFEAFDTDICFMGHTHLPAVLSDKMGVLRVREGNRYLINVGSVGQPRDHDPRASYGVFDSDSFHYELVRVPYDVEGAIDRIKSERLPRRLGKRLRVGE
ncbi:MAG: metallophosphoesterase family protein [Rhodothermales bacterium]